MLRLLGNVLWLLLGGLPLALGYAVAGLLMLVLIVTVPFGIQALKLASFSAWPFGRVMVARPGAGPVTSTVGNVVWVLLAGWWLALGHVVAAVLNAVTVIGIPFALAHLKLAAAAFVPFGQTMVPRAEARARDLAVGVAVASRPSSVAEMEGSGG